MAVVHLTKSDFDKKIKSGLSMVDFWAEWCVAPEVRVSTSTRSGVAAGRIGVGSRLLAMGEVGLTEDLVEAAKVVSDGGNCKLLITEAGREIKVTDDHLFFTQNGWRRADELKMGDKTAVLPEVEEVSDAVASGRLIVGSEVVAGERYRRELEKMGLLPLKLSHAKLPLLARILGAVFSDGNLYEGRKNNYREVSFALGRWEDVEELRADLQSVGIRKIHVSERRSENEINGRKFIAHTYKVKVLSTAFWRLLVALGAPVGRKADIEYGVPEWLFGASQLVRREFLAAYLGGDGPRVDLRLAEREKKLPYNSVSVNDLEFHKRWELGEGGMKFGEDLVLLFEEFGVNVARVFLEEGGIEWRGGRKSAIIHIRFKHDVATAYALVRRVGYVYCKQKQEIADTAGEFLARIMERGEKWQKKHFQALKWSKEGLEMGEIADKGKKATANKYYEKFERWLEGAKAGLVPGFLWDVVAEVKEVFLPQVARITVAASHNFVANGFVVHNCGPCKMSGPVIDEMSVEYAGKVLIAKVDVDTQPELAQRYGVMSIPTVILYKDGVEIGRQVGFAGKAGYLQLLSKAGI